MKINKLAFLLFFLPVSLLAQDQAQTAATLRRMADRILASTTYRFINPETKQTYTSTKKLPATARVKVESQYNDWHYTNGVLNIAMLELAEQLNQEQYKNFVYRNFDFVFNQGNLPYFEKLYNEALKQENGLNRVRDVSWYMYFRGVRLDDNGPMGASLIEVYQQQPKKNKEYKKYIDAVAKHIMEQEPRLPDGTIARLWPHEMTIWADDLFMSVSFLSRMGKLTGEQKYFDDAAQQVIQFSNYLWDADKGIYYHCYHSDTEEHGVAYWARANGWMFMAQADLLAALPQNHPKRSELLQIFRRQADGIARYQSESGLWHNLIDKIDSYEEVSATAMYVFGMATGVKNGWLPVDYGYVAEQGWSGILRKIGTEGNVTDVCTGTGIMPSLTFYYKRPTDVNTPMGEGPVMRAGVAMLGLPKYVDPPAHLKYRDIETGEWRKGIN
ncbi:glycoside hydrolase family 88 protein [Pontibacter brevis]